MRCVLVVLALAFGAMSGPVEDQSLQEFTSGNRIFTARTYKELIKSKTGNIIVSPLSVETALALTSEGTKGDTTTELLTGLNLPSSSEKIQNAFKSLLPKLKRSEEDLKLLSANKIYAGAAVKLEPSFNSVATTVYDSAVENVDFEIKEEAARTINAWVEANTDNKIKNLIDPEILGADTRVVLVNALYFSGKWVTRFENYATKKRKFYRTKDETVDVDTMYQAGGFRYYENPTLGAKFLEIPYKGDDISMVVVLPNEIDGLTSLEQNIEQVLEPQPFRDENVRVYLPKFVIETETDFVPILKNLGIQRLFDERCDLTGLSSTTKMLFVSDVVQKAFINVTEAGTEAAAATAVVGVERSAHALEEKYTFKVDRPFFYYIRYQDIVFVAGRYTSK